MIIENPSARAVESSVPKTHRSICVSFSGGVDSTVLLDICYKLHKTIWQNKRFYAVHVNHELSENSAVWEQHCKEQCKEKNIEFVSLNVDLRHIREKGNIEELARNARYAALSSWASSQADVPIILLGHHQSDQTETFFLNLKRGSGIKGLSGMPKHFILSNNVEFCRPLLSVAKRDILDYANEQHLGWVDDESNINERFERNFLRHSVLPSLDARWPFFSRNVNKAAELCRQQSELIDEFAEQTLDEIISKCTSEFVRSKYFDSALPIPLLLQLKQILRNEVIRFWFKSNTKMSIGFSHLNEIEALLTSKNTKKDTNARWSLGKVDLRIYQDHLVLCKTDADDYEEQCVNRIIQSDEPFTFEHPLFAFEIEAGQLKSYGKMKRICPADQPVNLMFGSLSDKIKISLNRPTKTIKNWCKEAHIPHWWRQQIPIIKCGNRVLAVITREQIWLNVNDF